MKYIITEPQFDRMVVGNLIPAPKYVAQELNRLKEWIYYKSGLGLEDIINDLLDPLKSNISEDEINKYKEGSAQIEVLQKIKYTLGKFVEFTKDVNEETMNNARLWTNKKVNLYNAIDNFVIIKILEHNNNTDYIDEFKENIRKIDGDIVFLKIDE